MVVAILIMGISTAMAQQGEKAVGANINYGSEISNLGIGVKFQYGLTDVIRFEPSFTYYLKKDGCNFFNLDANVHYLYNIDDKVTLYPLAGIGFAKIKFSAEGYSGSYGDTGIGGSGDYGDYGDYGEPAGEISFNEFALNLGVGAEYKLQDNLSVGAELKYQIINNFNQLVLGVGFTYKF